MEGGWGGWGGWEGEARNKSRGLPSSAESAAGLMVM
jgi:hypothetical protein